MASRTIRWFGTCSGSLPVLRTERYSASMTLTSRLHNGHTEFSFNHWSTQSV